jgi:chaperone modulatory protein CbpM
MNMEFDEILAVVEDLDANELTIWIESGWVRPEETVPVPKFSAVDVARVRLIHECIYELGVEVETLPLVLSLVDQVYGLRRELAVLVEAVEELPEETKTKILQRVGCVRQD